ncbi:MAG TPA: hypothetical protein VLX11_00290 [Candidatus Acidoferrales bacterium]|nr:hypothetical protein [Candidatus Acidoferrales bacterium]
MAKPKSPSSPPWSHACPKCGRHSIFPRVELLPSLKKGDRGGFVEKLYDRVFGKSPLSPLFQRGGSIPAKRTNGKPTDNLGLGIEKSKKSCREIKRRDYSSQLFWRAMPWSPFSKEGFSLQNFDPSPRWTPGRRLEKHALSVVEGRGRRRFFGSKDPSMIHRISDTPH